MWLVQYRYAGLWYTRWVVSDYSRACVLRSALAERHADARVIGAEKETDNVQYVE
jgi:hypothetical protein